MKYRPHRGSLEKSMAEVVDLPGDLFSLVEYMRAEVGSWYPKDDLPTALNTKVEFYSRDERIGWNTHIVSVNGVAWGWTDGPLIIGDGIALKAMADPNFDEDGNCVNETMESFLRSRIRPI